MTAPATPVGAPAGPSLRRVANLDDAGDRLTHTPAALEGYLRLTEIWRLTTAQASALLGGEPNQWFRIKAHQWDEPLSKETLTRISALVGVYKGLHLLFSDSLADDWVRRANSDCPFSGKSPIDFMMSGGVPNMLETRNYVDALRGGL